VALFEPEVLEVAREADPRAVTALMRRFEHALDPDGADEKALRRQERRGLTLVSLPDGTTLLRGLADEVTGSLISTAVDAASPVVRGDRRTAAQRRFDGLADICRKFLASPDARCAAAGTPTSSSPSTRRRSPGDRATARRKGPGAATAAWGTAAAAAATVPAKRSRT
jgi:hypothetical protein